MKKRKKSSDFGNFDISTDNLGNFELKQTAPAGSPFDDLKFSGDLEKDAKAELNEYQKALKESKRKYEKTVNGVFDSDFWCAFAFRDREECEEFLKELGFNPRKKYFNGRDLLKKIRSMIKK